MPPEIGGMATDCDGQVVVELGHYPKKNLTI